MMLAVIKAAMDPEKRSEVYEYFKDEYECDRFIAHMTKPVIALLDGITSESFFAYHRKCSH